MKLNEEVQTLCDEMISHLVSFERTGASIEECAAEIKELQNKIQSLEARKKALVENRKSALGEMVERGKMVRNIVGEKPFVYREHLFTTDWALPHHCVTKVDIVETDTE